MFAPITRDERQQQCIRRWYKAKGKAVIEACTGFGKTRIATNIIGTLLNKKPQLRILIVVPTTTLKEQWSKITSDLGYALNCEIQVINTVIKQDWQCDLLIVDEIHRVVADQFREIFNKVSYKCILGLTATIERLDGKHELLKQFCPIVDTVTLLEAMANGWVAPYREYQVILNVDNIQEYRDAHREFTEHFAFFNYDFGLAMSMVGPKGYIKRLQYRDEICPRGSAAEKSVALKNIIYHATGLMRTMQARKKFINSHPKKLEVTRKIIQSRPDAKIITFSGTVDMAEKIGIGKVYSGRDSKKAGRITLEEIKEGKERVLNTVAKCNEGLDMPGLSVAIIQGLDSSSIKAVQRVGRVCRFEEGKQAEIFNLIIADTVETEWFRKSHAKTDFITIDEAGLDAVLRGEDPKPYKKKIKDFTFRF